MPKITRIARGWVRVGDVLLNLDHITRISIRPLYRQKPIQGVGGIAGYKDDTTREPIFEIYCDAYLLDAFGTHEDAHAFFEEIVTVLK